MIDLDALLRPMPASGEVLRFDLSAYRSTVTREVLQVRVRMTARAFGTGSDLIAASLTPDRSALEVDAAALQGVNATVRAELESGPETALSLLRDLSAAAAVLGRVASAFEGRVAKALLPRRESFLGYLGAAGRYQALGALKFCVPDRLRPEVAAWLDDPGQVEALLSPDGPSLWSVLSGRELALARARLQGPASTYRRRLVRHRRSFGYLAAEDVDFRASESLEALDARLAALGAGGPKALAAERRRLARALSSDRAAKLAARRVFADRLAAREASGDTLTLLSHVLLARALAAHEDLNRRAKMRFLRDLRDLADLAGLPLEHAGLRAFADACAPPRSTVREASARRDRAPVGGPSTVLRST